MVPKWKVRNREILNVPFAVRMQAAWKLRGGGGSERAALKFRERFPKRTGDFLARNLATAKLHAQMKRRIASVIVKDERARTRFRFVLFLADAARFVAREPAVRNVHHHVVHLFFVGLPRNLQQKRFGNDAIFDAGLANGIGDVANGQGFGYGRASAADF